MISVVTDSIFLHVPCCLHSSYGVNGTYPVMSLFIFLYEIVYCIHLYNLSVYLSLHCQQLSFCCVFFLMLFFLMHLFWATIRNDSVSLFKCPSCNNTQDISLLQFPIVFFFFLILFSDFLVFLIKIWTFFSFVSLSGWYG